MLPQDLAHKLGVGTLILSDQDNVSRINKSRLVLLSPSLKARAYPHPAGVQQAVT